jgi:hypothetical protein
MISIKQILSVAIPFAAGCSAVLGYSYLTRTDSVAPPPALVVQTQTAKPTQIAQAPAAAPAPAPVEPTLSEKLAKWTAETDDENAETRASAITALGTGPRPEVIPTLRKILETGRSEPDRQLALQSLRKLALEQGDADGVIRNAVRQVIYHASEETMIGSARQVLDEIESAPAS